MLSRFSSPNEHGQKKTCFLSGGCEIYLKLDVDIQSSLIFAARKAERFGGNFRGLLADWSAPQGGKVSVRVEKIMGD